MLPKIMTVKIFQDKRAGSEMERYMVCPQTIKALEKSPHKSSLVLSGLLKMNLNVYTISPVGKLQRKSRD